MGRVGARLQRRTQGAGVRTAWENPPVDGKPEHPGRTSGKGVVSWKYGFRDYIESYRSRQRRKNDERENLRRLEERSKTGGRGSMPSGHRNEPATASANSASRA